MVLLQAVMGLDDEPQDDWTGDWTSSRSLVAKVVD